MTDKKFQFVFSDLEVSLSHIEKVLGYDEDGEREMIRSVISETMTEASEICNIRAEYRIYKDMKLEDKDKSLYVNNIHFEIGKIVFNQLKKSEMIAVFVCTAGEEIGNRSRELMSGGDPLKGYIMDTIGSVVVDAAADMMQKDLETSVFQSAYKITNRYYPGYCGWSVEGQHNLFGLIPDNFCGIRLTHSALMDPVKSASGIIGIGKHVRYYKYTCSFCDMKDCVYRGIKEEKEDSKNVD
jgi:hypothetical protein